MDEVRRERRHRRQRAAARPGRRVRMAVGGVVLGALALSGLSACEPVVPDTYVALGDSGVAGMLIPNQIDPIACMRSDQNYPHLVAAKVKAKIPKLQDRSCSGAVIDHLYVTQQVATPNPPQMDALSASTKAVSIGIGANDMDIFGIVQSCATANPFAGGCQALYSRSELDARISRVAAKYATALRDIKEKAPNAVVFVVESASPLPPSGPGCFPVTPVQPMDMDWARDLWNRWEQAMRAKEVAAGVVRVALPGRSSHHLCADDRWIEPLIPGSASAPLHPNAAAHRAQADALANAMNARFTS